MEEPETNPEIHLPTFFQWQEAKRKAADESIPWHKPWNDYYQFVADVGYCASGGRVEVRIACIGFAPGNAYWKNGSPYRSTYGESPVAVGLFKAGMISEAQAVQLTRLDCDPEFVREQFKALDLETLREPAEERRPQFAALIAKLDYWHGTVPKGEPSRWRIRNMSREIRIQNEKEGRGSYSRENESAESADESQVSDALRKALCAV